MCWKETNIFLLFLLELHVEIPICLVNFKLVMIFVVLKGGLN